MGALKWGLVALNGALVALKWGLVALNGALVALKGGWWHLRDIGGT